MKNSRSVLFDVPLYQLAEALSLREALLERLDKARAHINAVDRKLLSDPDRGIWSARQAQTRIAEVWLWLNHHRTDELPDLERSLDRTTTDERLASFAQADKSDRLEAAWADIERTERAILDTPCQTLTYPPRTETDRSALNSAMSMQDDYLVALGTCLRVVEDAVAERYVAVRPGCWLRLHDGALGRMVSRHGLRIVVLMPDKAWPDPKQAHRAYVLPQARIQVLREPPIETIGIPAYYWLCHAYAAHRIVKSLLKDQNQRDVKLVAEALGMLTDAAAKVWLTQLSPDHPKICWSESSRLTIEALSETAPQRLSQPLREVTRFVDRLRGSAHLFREEKHPSWPLKAAVAAQSLTSVLGALGDALQAQVRLNEGARVIIAGTLIAEVIARDGKQLLIRTPHGAEAVLTLFEDFLEYLPEATLR
jgi:hypothetical protein